MLEEQLVTQFARQLRAETLEKRVEFESITAFADDEALAEVVLGYLEEAGLVEDHEFCAYEDQSGRNRCRITAYSLPPDGNRLELYTARYVPETGDLVLSADEVERLAGRAARFFSYAARKEVDRFIGNEAASAAAQQIGSELGRIDEVRIHVLTNVVVKDRAVETLEIEGRNVEFSIVDIERLYRLSREAVTREHIEIDFEKLLGRPVPCLEMTVRPQPTEYETFLLIFSGELIYQLYEEFGARLFEFNVRSFLQATGKVNKGLRSTLRTQPERFLAYNNGITATADEIEAGTFHGETVIKRIKGLQIVNGAQTTASIYRAGKVDKSDLRGVAVAVKLTRVRPDKLSEFVPLIAQYANTQNVIQIADLSANSPFHIALEQLSERVWCPGEESRWFYERARGAYQATAARVGATPARRRDFERECPRSNRFGKTDIAKFLMSWWQQPFAVSRGAQKNFTIFMAQLPERYPKGWNPDEAFYKYLVSLAIIFRTAQAVVRRLKLQSYGANVITYTVAKLCHDHGQTIDLPAIWENQAVTDELEKTFGAWAPRIHQVIIDSAGRTNITEWCKKTECWDAIKALRLELPVSPPPEIVVVTESERAPGIGVDGRHHTIDLVETCCKLDSAQWANVVAWAAGSNKVPEFDQRVANTIAGYAMAGWRHRPSEKQARIAARVLQAAAKDGIIDLPV